MITQVNQHWRLTAVFLAISVGLLVLHAVLGTPDGRSYGYNLSWFDGFRTAFWRGDLYPRYISSLWYGFGGADFYFYGPLPFWIGSTLGQATCPTCSTATVFSISGAWMIILSGVSFFVFAHRYFASAYAGFGALIYMVLPYHYFMDWYYRQTIGEVAGMMVLPLLALASAKLLEEKKGGVLFALSLAALVFSHLPTTLIAVHLIAALCVWTIITQFQTWTERTAMLVRFGIWGALGLALSAIYWLPALTLLDSVSPHMLYLEYNVATNWLLLDGRPEFREQVSTAIKTCLILVIVVAASASFAMRYTPKASTSLRLWIIGPSLFTTFLMTVFSYPIWDMWILNKVQFPYRTLTVSDLSIALGTIVVAKFVIDSRGSDKAVSAKLTAGLCSLAFVFAYMPQAERTAETVQSSQKLDGAFPPIGVPEYIPPLFLEPALTRYRSRITDATPTTERFSIFFEEVRSGYAQGAEAMRFDAPGAMFATSAHDRSRLIVDLAEARRVRVPIAVWPHWRARLSDGTSVSLQANELTGLFSINLPAGRSEVDFYVVETLPQKIGSSLSLVALLSLLGYGLAHTYPRRDRAKTGLRPLSGRVTSSQQES